MPSSSVTALPRRFSRADAGHRQRRRRHPPKRRKMARRPESNRPLWFFGGRSCRRTARCALAGSALVAGTAPHIRRRSPERPDSLVPRHHGRGVCAPRQFPQLTGRTTLPPISRIRWKTSSRLTHRRRSSGTHGRTAQCPGKYAPDGNGAAQSGCSGGSPRLPHGGHGVALGNQVTNIPSEEARKIVPEATVWPELAARFIRQIFTKS